MNNHQRGVYQPAMDNIPTYDLSDDEVEEEHSRLPLLIVIALLVLAAFAGVVWLAYNQGVARGRAGATVIIAAPDGPVRTAAPDNGALETPYTGLKVYGQPASPEQEAQTTTLAPQSQAQVELPPPNPVVPPAAQPKASAATEAPPIRLNPPPAPPAPKAVASQPAAQPPQVVQSVPPATQPIAAAAPASSAVSGKAVLQIGAYETAEIANGQWTFFRARHGAVVGELTQDIQRADLGAKGIWYRLRIGPFADKAAAAAACEKLKTEGGTCFVAAP
jgi:outer membrane biosynthesis protein TonB